MTDKKVRFDDETEAFDEKNVAVLKGFAEIVQALGILADAAKGIKTAVIYLGAGLGIWAAFNSGVLSWIKNLFA